MRGVWRDAGWRDEGVGRDEKGGAGSSYSLRSELATYFLPPY